MSTLTVEKIGVIARRRTGKDAAERLNFEAAVGDALKSLARKVSRREDYVALRKEINVSAVSGVIALSDETLLLDTVPVHGVLILGGARVPVKALYEELELTLPKDVHYAALRNRKLYVKEVTSGALGSCAHAGTLEASYVPTLSELPDVYDEELIDEVVRLCGGDAEETRIPGLHGREEGINVNLGPRD